MNLSDEIYTQVDAFTDSAFKGNPAAVCLLEEQDEKDNQWLQSVASEFNMPMTAYLTPIHGNSVPRFGVRYFTPSSTEVYISELNLRISYILYMNHLLHSHSLEAKLKTIIYDVRTRTPDTSLTG
jgi:hypothetical protein